MPAKKFRFVSPGVQIKEIDKSILPDIPDAIGPVVVGRSLKGPSMVPVTVRTYEEFVQKFGEPSLGLGSNDIWRNGNNTGPTYGAYAAQAWLESSSPLTFLRLAGVKATGADSEGGSPGWKLDKTLTTSASTNGGAYGLFLIPSSSANNDQTGSLAAIFYLNEGSLQLIGTGADKTTAVTDGSGSAALIRCLSNLEFKAKIDDASGSSEIVSFNFDKNSSKFIRKAFNTNPTLTNSQIFDSDSQKTYWLGESFEDHLVDSGILSGTAEGSVFAFVAGLKTQGTARDLANFKKEVQPASTGWVFSQHLSSETGSFDPATDTVKLFRLHAGEGLGSDWEQGNYKISIFDIKPPRSSYQKYGTFSVGIRHLEDEDKSPEFVEVFSNLTLDPNSPDYIAARIGDRRVEWNVDADGKGRFVELGNYSNNSKVIRVEMHPAAASVDGGLLPAGFFGPTRYNTITLNSGSLTAVSGVLGNDTPSMFDAAQDVSTFIDITASVVFPSLPLVVSASDAGLLDDTQAYFGMKIDSPMKHSIKDLLRVKPAGISATEKQTETEYSFVFTLDDVVVGASGSYWQKDSRKNGDSYSASGSNDFNDLLEYGHNKFTMPLVGGFDGLDIREREPFRNSLLDDSSDEKQNYAFHSVKRAIESLKDPEVLDMNLLVVPGVTNEGLTNQMIKVCENRADAMAIIDLEGGYEPETENSNSEASRIGSVSSTITQIKERNLNSSYGCAYYPWVQMQDSNTGVKLWIPPSVAAFGTMASSQEASQVWFAPAGFNRGGLSLGSSGLSIVNVRDKLTAKNLDALYERNVNLIASFLSEGIVIFGQKTLQAVPSALDRINVRRLVIFLKKEISRLAANVLFEPNVQETWKRFSIPANELLSEVKTGLGISDYRLVLDETTTTPEEIDRNMMYAKLFIKPVYAIEFIGIDFVITNTGASFDDL
jgi:hypothetical protein